MIVVVAVAFRWSIIALAIIDNVVLSARIWEDVLVAAVVIGRVLLSALTVALGFFASVGLLLLVVVVVVARVLLVVVARVLLSAGTVTVGFLASIVLIAVVVGRVLLLSVVVDWVLLLIAVVVDWVLLLSVARSRTATLTPWRVGRWAWLVEILLLGLTFCITSVLIIAKGISEKDFGLLFVICASSVTWSSSVTWPSSLCVRRSSFLMGTSTS